MRHLEIRLERGRILIVGSFGGAADMAAATTMDLPECCDLAEIRLDLLATEDAVGSVDALGPAQVPLLFTARRQDEGGGGDLAADRRSALLERFLDRAAAVDIEVASIPEMDGILAEITRRSIPWIASYHDFTNLPATADLIAAASRAANAGASVFKVAARLHSPGDIARLADFQLKDHGIPVATMGMGRLAPVSRLLCAQCGSVLNYGYIGSRPTAPGQWDCGVLKRAIDGLAPLF